MKKPVCLIIGAGAGIGGNVAHRFARDGFHVCLCRRSDEKGLQDMIRDIETAGGSASGYILNALEENSIEDRVETIEKEIGPIEVALYNLGAQIGNKTLAETSYK
ncbi:MAG: NAD(P)-dependent dehydrogenase (short-subunit alcohol dehydrogenase family), partial [Cyclobacteriaceae bacterium]